MKKGRIFANILYYLFTFIIGFILTVTVPAYLTNFDYSIDYVVKSLENGEFSNAYSFTPGYYDNEYVYQAEFESGGGIVLFSSATLIDVEKEDGQTIINGAMHKAYGGYIYGVGENYKVTKTYDNKAQLIVTDISGTDHIVQILDSDSSGDEINDTCATHYNYGFIYVDLYEDLCKSIQNLKLIDADGNTFAELNVGLDYSESFFGDVEILIDSFNHYAQITDKDVAETTKNELNQLDSTFLAIDSSYCKQSGYPSEITERADHTATIIVVVYFICIYLIGDIALGGRFVIKFFKWILVKVFKVKFKQRKPKHNEVFGHDYFCKVTLQADVSAIEDFDGSVQIRYSNEDSGVAFVLLKGRNYAATEQVKAGEYVNLWIDLDEKYVTQDLPETLEAEGYQKYITFKIIKRED